MTAADGNVFLNGSGMSAPGQLDVYQLSSGHKLLAESDFVSEVKSIQPSESGTGRPGAMKKPFPAKIRQPGAKATLFLPKFALV